MATGNTTTNVLEEDRGSYVRGILWTTGLVVAFWSFLLLVSPGFFWIDDNQLSFLPVSRDIARAWSEGEFPILSPYSWVCSNLAGEYQHGIFSFYVTLCDVLIWSFHLSLPARAALYSLLHLIPMSVGAYLLARSRGLRNSVAILVALVTAWNGKMIAWCAVNWVGALACFTWVPWMWWCWEKGSQSAKDFRWFLLSSVFLYLVLTAGSPHTVPAVFALSIWFLLKGAFSSKSIRIPAGVVCCWLIGLGLSAPAWISLWEYVDASIRKDWGLAIQRGWSVPPAAWVGLIVPSSSSWWFTYEPPPRIMANLELACGFLPAVAFFAGILRFGSRVWWKSRWEIGLLLILAVACMMPGIGSFRWMFRWLVLFHLVLALIAGDFLQRFWIESRTPFLFSRRVIGITIGAIVLSMVWGAGLARLPWTEYAEILTWAFCLWMIARRFPTNESWKAASCVAITFLSLILVYLRTPVARVVPIWDFPESMTRAEPLDKNRLYLSVYERPTERSIFNDTPKDYWTVTRPGNTQLFSGIRFVNGHSGVYHYGIGEIFRFSFNGAVDPGTIQSVILNNAQNGGMLDLLGIHGLIFSQPYLEFGKRLGSDWTLHYQNEYCSVYHRASPPQRFCVAARKGEKGLMKIPNPGIQLTHDRRSYMEFDVKAADQERVLLIARPYFRQYRAIWNGKDLEVRSLLNSIPAVVIPADGKGILKMKYEPKGLTIGIPILVVSALILLAGFARYLLRA